MIYAASKFETALLETIIRDRYVHVNRRMINSSQHIHERLVTTLRRRPGTEFNLLDLTNSGIVELGAPTDALRARNQQASQALGRDIYHGHSDVDGLIYPSRFDGNNNFAIFDRAIDKLEVVETGELSAHPALLDALTRLQIGIIED